ncbi:MAG: hypothetical protein ACXVIP_03395 [Halobacteriota archaeon]
MPSLTRLVLVVAVLVTLLTTGVGVAAALPPPQAPNSHANAVADWAAGSGDNGGNGDAMNFCLANGPGPQVCGPDIGHGTANIAHNTNGPDA